jgi:hypothetical protein
MLLRVFFQLSKPPKIQDLLESILPQGLLYLVQKTKPMSPWTYQTKAGPASTSSLHVIDEPQLAVHVSISVVFRGLHLTWLPTSTTSIKPRSSTHARIWDLIWLWSKHIVWSSLSLSLAICRSSAVWEDKRKAKTCDHSYGHFMPFDRKMMLH